MDPMLICNIALISLGPLVAAQEAEIHQMETQGKYIWMGFNCLWSDNDNLWYWYVKLSLAFTWSSILGVKLTVIMGYRYLANVGAITLKALTGDRINVKFRYQLLALMTHSTTANCSALPSHQPLPVYTTILTVQLRPYVILWKKWMFMNTYALCSIML